MSDDGFRKRAWLRPESSYANNSAVFLHVDFSTRADRHSIDAELSFRDCNESCSFDFSSYDNEEHATHNLAAIKRLERLVRTFRQQYESAYKELYE